MTKGECIQLTQAISQASALPSPLHVAVDEVVIDTV